MGSSGSRARSDPYPKQTHTVQTRTTTTVHPTVTQTTTTHSTVTRTAQSTVQHQQQQSAQPQQKPEPDEKTEIKMKKMKLDKKILERYVDLERQIRALEGRNVKKAFQSKEKQLTDLEQTVKQLETHHKDAIKQTAKERQDVEQLKDPSVKNFLKDQASFDAAFSKEQEEYLEALNNEEIAKKELQGVMAQRDQIKTDSKGMKNDCDKLQKLYTEQDELLASVFDGKYGSELENKLEYEIDMHVEKKQRISVARYKWQNARLLVHHAVQQLNMAVKKWTDLQQVDPKNMQVRFTMATEARNNLVAAHQNLTSSQKYLNTITFPYCKPDEMQTLSRASSNIYTDLATAERHSHALQCYTTTYKRASALHQWFDHVIASTIEKDLEKANKSVNDTTTQLRGERLRLIKAKIAEVQGSEDGLDINADFDFDDIPDPELQALAMEADNVSNAGDLPSGEQGQSTIESSGEGPGATPLPASELAPAPGADDLFGDIENLKSEHEKEMNEFNKAQGVNKARMEQGLQEKLRARRSHRQREATVEE